jgi:large subunit ribosomal protein L15
MRLNEISDNAGARRPRKRLGRGIGSGLGKTAGRGGKGQTARSGGAKAGFEGGQMPIYRRLPKRGFNNPFPVTYNEINLDRIQQAVDSNKLDIGSPVTIDTLKKAGVITHAHGGVRLLGNGELKAKIAFEVHYASKGAIAAVEKAGGSVKVLRPPKPVAEEKPKAEAKPAKAEPKAEKPAKAEAKPAKAEKKDAAPQAKEKPAKPAKEGKPAKGE